MKKPKKTFPRNRTVRRDELPAASNRGFMAAADADSREMTGVIMKAQELVDREDYQQAYHLAAPLWGKVAAENRDLYLALGRLLVFAAAGIGRRDEAMTYVRAGLQQADDYLDFHFAAAIIAAILSRYDETILQAQRYEQLWCQKQDGRQDFGPWDQSSAQRHQLLNALGVALLESGRAEEAEKVLREALVFKPGYDSTYINFSLLHRSQGRLHEAEEVLAKGLCRVPDSAQLKAMAADKRPRPTLSACLIVKNEEELLPRCLSSVKALADEIIVVDTGSDDRTVAIAEEFGARVFHFPWRGDFAAARNESLDHATKDWILIIDADEELPAEEVRKIRFLIDKPDVDAISISVYNRSLETGVLSSFLPSVRLFKRRLGLRYFGIVHNRLDLPPEVTIHRCGVRLYHYGYDLTRDKLEKKIARTRSLLEKQLADDPHDLYANFNMAQLLRGVKDARSPEVNRQILDHAQRIINHPDARLQKYLGLFLMGHHQAAMACFNLKQYEECEAYCLKVLEMKPDYVDPLLTLGNTYSVLGRLDKARTYYQSYLEALDRYRADHETFNMIMIYLENRHTAWYGLGVIAEMENDGDEAIRCFGRVLETRDHHLDTCLRLGKLHLDKRQPESAQEVFERHIKHNPELAEAFFGLGEALSMQMQERAATEQFLRASQLAPENAHIRFRLAKSCIKVNQTEEGILYLIEAAAMPAADDSVVMEAADLLFELHRYQPALEFYEKILARKPDNVPAMNNMANCLYRLGDFDKAEKAYRTLISQFPDYAPAYRNLGLACFKLNQAEEALTILNHYVQKCPEDFNVQGLIGDLSFNLNRFSDAIEAYEHFLRRQPLDQQALFRLAESYYQLGFGKAAAAGYRQVLALDSTHLAAGERLKSLSETACPV